MADRAYPTGGAEPQHVAEEAAVAYQSAAKSTVAGRGRASQLQWIKGVAQSGPTPLPVMRPTRTPREVEATLAGIRELVARRVPAGVSLADELVAERRAEHHREHSGLYG